MTDTELRIFDTAPPGAFDAIYHALDESFRTTIGEARPRLLVIPIHHGDGSIAGGLWAYTLLGWLHIEMMVVPEALRFRGLGSALLAAAEEEARQRGCLGAIVDTFSVHAGPFFRKLAFHQYAVLEDCPRGHQRLFFKKRFNR
jgi:GNAT superfamily N-acetyltransferase